MGFGVPAAIGAKIANPDKEVILLLVMLPNDEPRIGYLKYLQGANCCCYVEQPPLGMVSFASPSTKGVHQESVLIPFQIFN